MSEESSRALEAKVFDGESYRRFGQMTSEDAAGRASELKSLTGFGPTMRVRPVAMGWGELAKLMAERGAATVAELDDKTVAEYAKKLWILQPSGGIMQDPKGPS